MPASSHAISGVFQNSVYIGISIQNILYGVALFLHFETIYILLASRGARTKPNLFYAFFNSMMVFSITVWVATEAEHISNWYMDWGTTAAVVLQLMTDALMIYRCRVVWNSYRIIVIPLVLWLITLGEYHHPIPLPVMASFYVHLALGILVDWITSSPGNSFFTGVASRLGLAYYTVSVFLNATLTSMICYRMLRHGKMVQEYLGHEYASPYFTVVTIIVESVFPYALSGIAFLVSLGVGSPTSIAFFNVYVLMMCISPQMLILRVIAGRAWDKDTFNPPGSTVKFNPRATVGVTMVEQQRGESASADVVECLSSGRTQAMCQSEANLTSHV
ncbi:hypothetical protein J3R83DRAFT_3116 [Lanmaoa asiatica]|nr:hypothetical protein J3R83DRAFT_3116 [Lanmaoa asiatica]